MSLPIKCVCPHPSEATPTPKGEPPPPGESLTVNVFLHPSEATPTPKGATPPPGESLTVNVRLHPSEAALTLKDATPPLGESLMVNGINKVVNWSLEGLHPPSLATTGNLVTCAETNTLRLQNRRQCHALQDQ
jgi:hypothetical protein